MRTKQLEMLSIIIKIINNTAHTTKNIKPSTTIGKFWEYHFEMDSDVGKEINGKSIYEFFVVSEYFQGELYEDFKRESGRIKKLKSKYPKRSKEKIYYVEGKSEACKRYYESRVQQIGIRAYVCTPKTNYWERIERLKIYSLERRRERYMILYNYVQNTHTSGTRFRIRQRS